MLGAGRKVVNNTNPKTGNAISHETILVGTDWTAGGRQTASVKGADSGSPVTVTTNTHVCLLFKATCSLL